MVILSLYGFCCHQNEELSPIPLQGKWGPWREHFPLEPMLIFPVEFSNYLLAILGLQEDKDVHESEVRPLKH